MSDFATAVGKAFPWHEVYGPNAAAIREFYTQALGMGAESMNMGEMGDYHMLSVGGTSVAGIQDTTAHPDMANVPPHWAVYIAVDDVDARVAKITSLGGAVHVPAMDIPTVGRMALCADPNGAMFWVNKSENPS